MNPGRIPGLGPRTGLAMLAITAVMAAACGSSSSSASSSGSSSGPITLTVAAVDNPQMNDLVDMTDFYFEKQYSVSLVYPGAVVGEGGLGGKPLVDNVDSVQHQACCPLAMQLNSVRGRHRAPLVCNSSGHAAKLGQTLEVPQLPQGSASHLMPQVSSGMVAGAGRAAPTVEGVRSATTSSGFVPQSRVRHLPDAKLRSVHGRWCATTSMELGAPYCFRHHRNREHVHVGLGRRPRRA